MKSAADAARALKTAGALGCFASMFAPLTSFDFVGSAAGPWASGVAPFAMMIGAKSASDALFAALIGLAFLGPVGGAAHTWLGRWPESLPVGVLELIAFLYSARLIYGLANLGTPTGLSTVALCSVVVYGAGVGLHLVCGWRARRARASRPSAGRG